MNLKNDLTICQQELLEQLDIEVQDKKYSLEEIRQCENIITTHIMSQSSKNGDLSKEITKYSEVMNVLVKNEF